MNGSKVAIRYAKALLQQTENADAAKALFNDMQIVASTIDGSKDLRIMLHSPVIKAEDKNSVLLKVFEGQAKGIGDLIRVLVQNQRIGILGDVAKSYVQLYNESQGVKVAKVITAVPLSSELEEQVLAKVKELTGGSSVSIEKEIDPDIIGGFILRVGDLQYNASISNQLGNLKREFSKSI